MSSDYWWSKPKKLRLAHTCPAFLWQRILGASPWRALSASGCIARVWTGCDEERRCRGTSNLHHSVLRFWPGRPSQLAEKTLHSWRRRASHSPVDPRRKEVLAQMDCLCKTSRATKYKRFPLTRISETRWRSSTDSPSHRTFASSTSTSSAKSDNEIARRRKPSGGNSITSRTFPRARPVDLKLCELQVWRASRWMTEMITPPCRTRTDPHSQLLLLMH
mmetsp:Transcript_96096/g.180841  ORF Transcript_96096/g.180841 Transcript_96096/m.180841 type:complete len:219 (-) Transcript_96096:191-847(-)